MTDPSIDDFFENVSGIRQNLKKMSKINEKIRQTTDLDETSRLSVKRVKLETLTKTKPKPRFQNSYSRET